MQLSKVNQATVFLERSLTHDHTPRKKDAIVKLPWSCIGPSFSASFAFKIHYCIIPIHFEVFNRFNVTPRSNFDTPRNNRTEKLDQEKCERM